MLKKKLSLLIITAMTVSVLSAGFSKELVVHAETTITTEEVKQTYTDRVYLSDLEYMKASSYGTVKNDTNSSGAKIKLKVNDSYITFDKGLFAHASSDVIYDVESQISKGFDTFIAYAGVDASQGGKGSVKFIISVSEDNKKWTQVQTTDVVTSASNSIKIQQKLPQGTKYLRLQADKNGDNGNDHAVYGDAVLVSDEYLNFAIESGIKSVEDLDKEIIALGENAISVAKSYGHKLYQREFVNRVGYDVLERIIRDEPQFVESIKYLFENEKALSYFIETGVGDNGDSYLTVLQNFDSIYKKYENEIKNDEEYLLKLAVTTSWAFAKDVYFWAGSDAPQDVVERYEIYKSFTNDKDTLWSEAEIEFFKKQSPAMLKYTLNTRQNNDEIKWFADYIKNVKNGSMNGYHYVEYKGVKSFSDPKYYGEENFDKWDKIYNLSKYNIDTSNPNKVRWFAVMEIDGVCGAIAKTYTALQETYGRPSGVLNQPGHAAALISNNNGEWSIVNDVSGWTASRDEMGQMPLAWGMQSWNSNRSASYITLIQNVLDNYEDYQMATKLNILADVYERKEVNREEILNKALESQPNNLDAMYNLIQAYKDSEDKTSDNYLELARKVVANFKYYPLAMADLLAQIQPNIDENQLPLFDLIRTNALEEASVATDTDVKQSGITKTMANFLLNSNSTTKKVDTFTFSFSGDNANKLVVSDKYSNTEFATRYSIDGGETWTDTTSFPEIDLSSVVDKINAEDDILIKILGSNDIYRIDIKNTAAPTNTTVVANQYEDRFIGAIDNLEFSIDNGKTWCEYTSETKLREGLTVLARYKANGTNLQSSYGSYTFNVEEKDPAITYISADNIVNVTYANEQNAGSSGKHMVDGNPYTQWHTKWNMITQDKSYVIELKDTKDISAIEYLPAGVNGRIATLKVEVSSDGTNWTEAAISGQLDNNGLVKQVKFNNPVNGKFVKITALTTYGNTKGEINRYVSGYEFRLFEDLSEEYEMEKIMKAYVEPTISYSTTDITNKDVTATVKVTEGTTVVGENSKVFTANGDHTFTYTRPDGSNGTLKAIVSNIDKTAPTATVSYSVNKEGTAIVATAKLSDGTFIDGTNGVKELTDGRSYVFRFKDEAGNIGTVLAKGIPLVSTRNSDVAFNNININAVKVMSPVTVYVINQNVEVIGGEKSFTFTKNGTHVFTLKDKSTGEIRYVPVKVDWIYNMPTE